MNFYTKNHISFLSHDGVTKIHAMEWLPVGTEIRAILQINHGMVEFIERYDEFATFLVEQQILVVGTDHLGHGQSVRSEKDYGFFHEKDGMECVLRDIHTLRTMTQKKYPDVPYFMLGHSMGSFMTRAYLCDHGDGLAGVILSGTGSQPSLILVVAKTLSRTLALLCGEHYRSKFIDKLAAGGYNKAFEPGRTGKEWLTKDEAIVDAYVANPLCMFCFTVNGYYHMFRAISYGQNRANIARIPKTLPIHLASGDRDPVGSFGKGVKTAFESYRQACIADLSMKLYENDRHEILNELDRQDVYNDLLNWITDRI